MTDRMQMHMDVAYDRWQKANALRTERKEISITKEEFWDTLSANERLAVFAGNFNYQVTNGGFQQWHDNGYATSEVLAYLHRVCSRINSEISGKVDALLTLFEEAKEMLDEEDGYMDGSDGAWEQFSGNTSELDSDFYQINDKFLEEVEVLLAQ